MRFRVRASRHCALTDSVLICCDYSGLCSLTSGLTPKTSTRQRSKRRLHLVPGRSAASIMVGLLARWTQSWRLPAGTACWWSRTTPTGSMGATKGKCSALLATWQLSASTVSAECCQTLVRHVVHCAGGAHLVPSVCVQACLGRGSTRSSAPSRSHTHTHTTVATRIFKRPVNS